MDNTNPTNDVNTQPADTTTAGGSSPATQQTPAENAPAQENSEAQTAGNQSVPYERFKEVNDNFRKTQQELTALRQSQEQFQQGFIKAQQPQQPAEVLQAKQQLKGLIQELAPELGFVSKQEIEKQQQIQQVEQTHNQLEQKYNGKDGLPKYDKQAVLDYAVKMGFTKPEHLELAYKQMHDAEIMNARIQQAMQQSRGVKSEVSNGTGSANTGVSNDDLLKAAQAGDKNAQILLIKRRLSKK